MNKAFTLAEVLITLGIIGVVAAMTIPTILQNQQEKATVSALKKTYSTLSQAYTLAAQENGTPDEWGMTTGGGNAADIKIIVDNFSKYMRATKVASPSVWLQDGTIVTFNWIHSITCSFSPGNSYLPVKTECSQIAVDINGDKNPNKNGKDKFNFILYKYGVAPKGASLDGVWTFHGGGCVPYSESTAENCAAWVIYNENMDYLKCDNLNWTTKPKCN